MEEWAAQPKTTLSYREYLDLERTSEHKYEWLAGEAWSMAGGTITHARMAANVTASLVAALRGKPCAVFSSDLKVRVTQTDRSTYPDITVICGKPEVAADDPNAAVNPVAVVEVFSESTEASDRGEKFAHLQRLESLREYVLVNQRTQRVEVFRRAENAWELRSYEKGNFELTSLQITLKVEELYADPTA